MNYAEILYPLLALFIWVNLLLLYLGRVRFKLVQSRKIKASFYKIFQGDDQPEKAVAIARNITNLFEMPVFFYAIIILIYFTARLNNGDVGNEMVIAAWGYVAARIAHSLVHVTFNHVFLRFSLFIVSNLLLLALWGFFFSTYYLGR